MHPASRPSNNIIRAAGALQRVFVVSTPANHLFGVHRHTREGHYQSCVFGFRDRQHADLIARSLESYYLEHGTFPPRDLTAEWKPLVQSLRASDVTLENLRVEPHHLPHLLRRLRGTGIVVTLLSLDPPAGGGAFRCQDVYTDTSAASMVENLNRVWHRAPCDDPIRPTYYTLDSPPTFDDGDGARGVRGVRGVPLLLPKPEWRGPAGRGRSQLPVALAAWFIKFMVLVEAVTTFWLLPSLFI